jgi:hypothetical protein
MSRRRRKAPWGPWIGWGSIWLFTLGISCRLEISYRAWRSATSYRAPSRSGLTPRPAPYGYGQQERGAWDGVRRRGGDDPELRSGVQLLGHRLSLERGSHLHLAGRDGGGSLVGAGRRFRMVGAVRIGLLCGRIDGDYANIEVGGEIRGEQCGISPFVGVSLGAYTSGSVGGTSGDVANPSVHAWVQFGLRGVVNL